MKYSNKNLCRMIVAMIAVVATTNVYGVSVVPRGTPTTTTTTAVTNKSANARPTSGRAVSVSSTATTEIPAATAEPVVTETTTSTGTFADTAAAVTNRAASFSVGSAKSDSASDTAADALSELIRQQRAALDAQSADAAAAASALATLTNGDNACDINLRACMQSKCGKDYSKCSGDTDTMWGIKMDACRRDLPCTGEEYRLFTTEIKADRDMNARLAAYNAILDCGNNYNDCIITECGATYSECLGKKNGDAAIAKCDSIAKKCIQQDSGLAARTMEVFGTLRQTAEVQIKADEERLYALRDQMRAVCSRLGAMFDERSLDCVYTVEFYAGESSTLFASKKAYAGASFDCTPNWFGIDITTFKENAYRLTRSQTSATSALLGAGVGTAVGAVTSGVIDRAIDRQKADNALKKAEKSTEPEKAKKECGDKATERCAKKGKGVKRGKLGICVCYDEETDEEEDTPACDPKTDPDCKDEPADGEGDPEGGKGDPEGGEGDPEGGEGDPEGGEGDPEGGEGDPAGGDDGDPAGGDGDPAGGEGNPAGGEE